MAKPSAHRTPLAVAELRYAIGEDPLPLTLTLPASAQAALKKALDPKPKAKAERPAQVLLTVEEIEFEMKASGIVTVYLNLKGDRPDKETSKAQAVGTFAPFSGHTHSPERRGAAPPPHAKGKGGRGTVARFSRVFEVTEILRRLRRDGPWKEGELRVVFLRRPLDKTEQTLQGKVSFARVTLNLRSP